MKLFVRSKKGSLSLSMEAIVILILAVVMLGLGLTFVRTMFQNITDKARNAIDVADLTAKPSEGEPVVFSPNAPEIKEKNTQDIQIGFYNPSTNNDFWRMEVLDDVDVCGGLSGDDEDRCYDKLNAIYRNKPFELSKDQSTGWHLIIEPEAGAVPTGSSKPYLLTIKFCAVSGLTEGDTCDGATNKESYQKELFLTVRK